MVSPKTIALFIALLYLLTPSRFLSPAHLISAATETLAQSTFTPAWIVMFASDANGSVAPSCSDREMAHLQASVAASNLANVNTTRSSDGGAYKKKMVVRHRDGRCEVVSINAFKMIHDPANPDANAEGFVKYPDISVQEETRHLSEAREKLKKLHPTSRNTIQPQQSDIDVD